MALDSRFALTGAVFSRSPQNLAKAREKFRVGNLYLNRGSTGAMVERQPFGGFNMSGVGSKTGGPDYLLQFMDPRCVTENTLRRGFHSHRRRRRLGVEKKCLWRLGEERETFVKVSLSSPPDPLSFPFKTFY